VLEYLHGLHPPVIHRDIKPSNVIVQPDGKPVLVDFGGVAKVFAPGGATTVVGTFGYMAPEQLHGRVTPGIDLYALGATLAAMAAGEEAELLPRRGLDIDLSEAIAAGPLRRVLESMLYANPEQRPGSVDDVRAALRRARAGNLVRARPPESGLGSAALAPMTGPRVVAQRPRGGSRAPSMLSNVWGHMKPRHRGLAIAYLWIAVGLGVMTKALILSAFLLLLFPVLLGITHALRSDE
nr:hypothetical protein [Deltaproteobacteria bacterium]